MKHNKVKDKPNEFVLAKEFTNHNEKVYEYKGKYYSFDNYKHKGGSWKVMVKRGGRLHRIATYNKNLNLFDK